jgi:isocitrate dehydrogenase kinase/phosphatase
MFPEANGTDQDKGVAPEIAIIKDILLSDLRRSHEARMEKLEERIATLCTDVDSRLLALAVRIEAVAAESGQSQKKALAEIGEAITQIALGLKPGEGTAENVGS